MQVIPDSLNGGMIDISTYLSDKYSSIMHPHQLEIIAKRVSDSLEKRPYLWNRRESPPHEVQATLDKVIFSPISPWTPNMNFTNPRKKIIFDCLRGNMPPFCELLKNYDIITSALFIQKQTILDKFRSALQLIFCDIYLQLITNDDDRCCTKKNNSDFHMEIIIGDLLSLYPLFHPIPGEIIKIPVLINGEWEFIEYKVTTIQLTPEIFGSPILAYSLVPVLSNFKAPAKMVFKSTTYPTDEGYLLNVLTDFTPGYSVGASAFIFGQEKIERWLETHSKASKVRVYGKSLGAAQAWRTALYFPQFVEKAYAYAPPGFSNAELQLLKKLHKQGTLPKLFFFCQADDLVHFSDLGTDEGVHYYEIIGSTMTSNPFFGHAAISSTQDRSVVLKLDAKKIALSPYRKYVTLLRQFCSLGFPIVLGFHLLKRFWDTVGIPHWLIKAVLLYHYNANSRWLKKG